MKKLDRGRPFGYVMMGGAAVYEQDGHMFDIEGNALGPDPDDEPMGPQKPEPTHPDPPKHDVHSKHKTRL